jgi:hypothetical protein
MRFFHVQTSKTVKRSSFGIWSVSQAATCRAQGGAEAQGKGTSATQKSQCQYNSPRFDPWRGWRLCGSFVPSDFLKFKLQNVDKALTLSIVHHTIYIKVGKRRKRKRKKKEKKI